MSSLTQQAHRVSRAYRGHRTDPGVVIVPTTWAADGACTVDLDTPAEVAEQVWAVFDEPTSGATPTERVERLATARRICAGCPVLEQCREFGMHERFGFFGGLTPEERAARRRGDTRPHEDLAAEIRAVEIVRERASRGQTTREGATA